MTHKTRLAAILILLRVGSSIAAATLNEETKEAWEAHLQAANAAMQARLQPGAHFLWLDDQPGRAESIRTKGAYIAPIGPHIPKKLPSGLSHDWLGVGFVPNATIEDVLRIVRNYDSYKDIYRPGVIDSISHRTEGMKDLFSMPLANKSVVAKTALDTDCEASYFRVDDRHWYSVSNTIHIQEIDKFGTLGQRTLPEDQGTGLIWRLSSITRLEERDGGVYEELEAMASSRDIPAVFRLFVTPIVRRVDRFPRHISSPSEGCHRCQHGASQTGKTGLLNCRRTVRVTGNAEAIKAIPRSNRFGGEDVVQLVVKKRYS